MADNYVILSIDEQNAIGTCLDICECGSDGFVLFNVKTKKFIIACQRCDKRTDELKSQHLCVIDWNLLQRKLVKKVINKIK